jgi:hypothetical protein
MNVEIGAEAAPFPEKSFINGNSLAVWCRKLRDKIIMLGPYKVRAKSGKGKVGSFYSTRATTKSRSRSYNLIRQYLQGKFKLSPARLDISCQG